MALSSPPTTVAAFDEGRLNAGISASATTITVAPIYKTISGVRTKQGFNTTAGLALIRFGKDFERISFEGASVDGTTKVTTLTTCTRGLSVTATSASFSGGTGKQWPKGAKITVVADASYFQSGVFTNVANTFTANQTVTGNLDVSGRIRQTGTSGALEPPQMTTTQRDNLASQRGIIENTTTGTLQQYTGGAWANFGTDATANGSTTVAGKYEEATVAEQGTATATGGTGARLIPAVANLVKTGAGAGDENKIAILNSVGAYDVTVGGTGRVSITSGALLVGAGASQMTVIGPGTSGQVPLSNGTTIAMGSLVAVGSMMLWTTDTPPTGWLLCYGQAVSRTTYSALFTVISTTYGTGDGSTTFNLPDTRGRFPAGQDDMGGSSANRITDSQADNLGQAAGTADGAHTHSMTTDPDNGAGGANINYSTGAATGSTSVLPPYFTINFIIFANA